MIGKIHTSSLLLKVHMVYDRCSRSWQFSSTWLSFLYGGDGKTKFGFEKVYKSVALSDLVLRIHENGVMIKLKSLSSQALLYAACCLM